MMVRSSLGILFIFLFFNGFALGQKKALDHTVYNSWKSVKNQKISTQGNFISFEVNPHRGDGVLHFTQPNSKFEKLFPRGNKALFSTNEEVFVFSIKPGYDTLRTLELEEVKKEKWVKDTLAIYWIKEDSLVKIPNLLDFKIGKNGGYLAYTIDKDSLVKKEGELSKKEKRQKKKKQKKDKGKDKPISKGNTLFVLNLHTKEIKYIKNVSSFQLNKEGSQLFYITQTEKKKKQEFNVHLFDLKEECPKGYDTTFTEIGPITFGEKNNLTAFIASQDTTKENKLFKLYVWEFEKEAPKLTVDTLHFNNVKGLMPSNHGKLDFSENGEKLFFGLSDVPEKEEKDTLVKSEKAILDIWHYQDKRLQPQQLKELKKDKDNSFRTVLHLKSGSIFQLESDTLNVRILDHGNSEFALGQSNERYADAYNWSYPWVRDYYRVSLKDGTAELIEEAVEYGIGLSPNGKYFVEFNSLESQYYERDLDSQIKSCMTCEVENVNWQQDINGMIFNPGPEGSPGYVSENEILLYAEFDIWKYNFNTKHITSLTYREGEKKNIKFRLNRLEKDSTYIDLTTSLFHATDQQTFDEAIWTYFELDSTLTKRYETDHMLTGFQKAEIGGELIFRQMNTRDYPDLYFTGMRFENPVKLSEANPQQSEYIWPTVEIIEWDSYNGEELRGLVYKPEDFDSTKSYPLLVYFYETYTERKNRHYIPQPTASIIYPTEYTSAGYVVFIPDILYEPGYPGKSAYNSIMSGTDKVLELYPNIDSTKMGLQGQSWGGYQAAQLITMTDRYAVAMAGAPVSNMFSAYGGIRWASGLNRAFQYEHTQSRIGKTIWEAPELYVENSPLFGVPNIKTPLLIMHNDDDGAVPWYQGIELFTAMKRLQKPVWMLNYNGDGHNLMKNANRMDLSIRMRQFFDYYLLDQPAPEWLINGLPAIEKGKTYKLESITN